jgi:hypothetical protein
MTMLLSAPKAAHRLGVSVKALRLLVRRGLPKIIVGKRLLFVEAEMADWLKREAECSSSIAVTGTPHWWVSFSAGGHRIRRSLRTNDRETANQLAAGIYRDALTGQATGAKPSLTLDHALSRYVAEHARYLPSAQTIKHQGKALVRIIGRAAMLGGIDDAVVAVYVAKRRGDRAARGHGRKGSRRMDRRVSNSTVNREVGLLRAVMERARKLWKLDVADVNWKLHRLQEADHRTRYLTADEADRLLAAAKPHLRAPLITALYTGLRLSAT